MPQVCHWIAYTALPRNAALQRIQEAVKSPAFITDFHFFSDLSAALQIEVPVSGLPALLEGLESVVSVEMRDALPVDTEANVLVMLQLNFAGGSGMLRHPVPEVPG